ncbi:MAG: YCF48-related protein [Acidobacteriota bacterium]
MEFNKRAVAIAFVSLIALGALGCKGSQNNSNQPSVPGAAAKPGKWVAQYRSPASLSYSGMNLAVFYYSGISVVSANIVFVCGDTPNPKSTDERIAVILRTTDGGQHWTDTPIELPRIQIPTLNSIHFISPDVGWAVGVDSGADGVVLKTTDGGSSWTATRIGHKEVPTTVFFVDANNGWIGGATPPPGDDEGIGGPSALLATTDGGNTWQSRYNVPISIYRVFFVDKMNGWASGSKGVIYNTADGGLTWNTQRTEIEMGDGPLDLAGDGVKQFAISGLQFIDKDHGFAAASATEGEAGRMLVTSNGGVAWRRQWILPGAGVRDVFFLNPNEGWALTDKGPYVNYTVDGGRSWLSELKVFEQDVTLSRVAGVDAAHIWAVGGGAIFFRVSE